MGRPSNVVVCFNPAVPGAEALAERLFGEVRAAGREAALKALPAPGAEPQGEALTERLMGADLLVCVGGDGTVLHAAAFAAVSGTPIFGVRMGRLGFLTEATEAEAEAALGVVLEGGARLESRATLEASAGSGEPVRALNDIVIGRPALGRTISIGARIDGVLLAEYRGDAVIVATATGSTGYSLSVGGPILHPTSREIVLVPVAPHLTRSNALVLPEGVHLRLYVMRDEAVMTADGLYERTVPAGGVVEVACSPRPVEFVRLGGENQFYANLAKRLGWLRLDHVLDDIETGIVEEHTE